MSSSSWRQRMNQRSLPSQAARPVRQHRSPWNWEGFESRQLLSVTIGDVTMIEPPAGTANAVFKVALDQAHENETVKVDFRTEDATAKAGRDYRAVSGTLTFAPGETSKEIAVPIVGGLARGPHDVFTVKLSNPVNETLHPSLRVGTGTILPTPWLSVGDAKVVEGGADSVAGKKAVFSVTLDPPNLDQVVSVRYTTADGSAKAGSDYQATTGTLSFAPGETSKTVTVPITGGTSVEPVESFTLKLTSPVNAVVRDGEGTGTITNQTQGGTVQFDQATIRIAPDSDSETATITVRRTNGTASGVAIRYTTKGGSAVAGTDYTPVSGTLSFAAGETSQTIKVPILANPKRLSDRTVELVLSDPTGGGTLGSMSRTTLTLVAPQPSTEEPNQPPPTTTPPTTTPPTTTPPLGEPTPTGSTQPEPAGESPAAPTTSPPESTVVTNIEDNGPGSLRQAILNANTTPGLDTIRFALPGTGTQTIRPTSPLPTITDPITIDGTSPSGDGQAPGVEINGAAAGIHANGLTIVAGGSTIRGLAINGFAGAGVLIHGAGGNQVERNVIGASVDGERAVGNGGAGIQIDESPNNMIGGSRSTAGNLVAGNRGSGIVLSGAAATNNVVRGNHIGTDDDGDDPMGNQLDGIVLDNAPRNRIGGNEAEQGNLISGNRLTGIRIKGPGATENVIEGNKIGTDRTGTRAVGNAFDGIFDTGAPGNLIGGVAPGAGNLISGNGGVGLQIQSRGAVGNRVQGNRIGTDAEGKFAVGNRHGGIFINNAAGNTIGGTSTATRNLISGNPLVGLQFAGRGARGNVVQSNLIGTDILGAPRLGNGVGVYLGGTSGNKVENSGPARNQVAGNLQANLASTPIPGPRLGGRRTPQTTNASITGVTKVFQGSDLASLIVSFSTSVDRTRAEDIINYRLRLPGRGERFNAPDAVPVPIRSAVYDPAASSVTLTLAQPLRSSGPIQLRVSGQPGRGIASLSGPGVDGHDYLSVLRLTS